jgi:2-iminobutanoate/2-iminopropanoate deaminase
MSRIVQTPDAPGGSGSTGGSFSYSQAVVAGGLVFVAGAIVGTTIQEQTRRCLQNIEAILEAAGSSVRKVVSVTFILRDPADFPGMNEEWVRWFPADPPARQGARHPLDAEGFRISLAAIAEA